MTREITIITVTYNSARYMDRIAKLAGATRNTCDLIIIDNGSNDGSADLARKLIPEVSVLETTENTGFGGANNIGISTSDSPFILFLNPDAYIKPENIEKLLETLKRHDNAAAVQPLIRLAGWPFITTSAGVSMNLYGEGFDIRFMHFEPVTRKKTGYVPCVTAAVALFRKNALDQVGGFDPAIFMYFEDVDLSLRLSSKGWKFLVAEGIEAEHAVGSSSSRKKSLIWELESSVILSGRYFRDTGSGLPLYWWKREFRIRLSSILKHKPWLWRIGAVRRGLSRQTEHVKLKPGVISHLIAKPGEKPYRRHTGGFPLDREGNLISGPGWFNKDDYSYIKRYGSIFINSGKSGKLGMTVRTDEHLVTGGIRNSTEVLTRFTTGKNHTDLEVHIPHGTRKLYMWLDDQSGNSKLMCKNIRLF